MLVISLVHTHRHYFWCTVERQIGKLKAWFLEIPNVALHVQVCLINVTKSLENGRKEIMGIHV